MCRDLGARGIASTAGYWNAGGDSPRRVANASLELLDEVAGLDADWYLSLKAPALGFSVELAREILERARSAGRPLLFDSMAPGDADATFRLLERLDGDGLGCALPARWRRSRADAELAARRGWRVRIVKGQWRDPHADVDPRTGFLELADVLAGRAPSVAVATHDVALAAEATARLRAAGTAVEHELLYGLPFRPLPDLPVRVYVPFGRGSLPYAVRSVLRRPRVLLWLARDLLNSNR
jgi:proline dehydrogenase